MVRAPRFRSPRDSRCRTARPDDRHGRPKDSGIGKKTAERLLLELKDKLAAEVSTAVGINRAPPASADILNALLALGYSDKEALRAVRELPEGLSVGEGIRQALKRLAKA
jgi:Holliday junction DNA helicase RuvA